jgi:HlyD family secretion protein
VTATGVLQPARTVDIKYDTQTLVARLFVKEGDRVATDQALATMDTRTLDLQRAQAEQAVKKDQVLVEQTAAALRRAEALAQDGLIARADMDVARANYESALHQTESDQQVILQTDERLRLATLRAPMDGVVIGLYVHEGELLGSAAAVAAVGSAGAARAGKPTNTLMTLASGRELLVDADVNALDLGGVRLGQEATFTVDAFQPKQFHGRVSEIALQPTVVNNVTTYQVKITITDPDSRFRIGLPANVWLVTTHARQAWLAPRAAIKEQNGVASVRVLRVQRESDQATRKTANAMAAGAQLTANARDIETRPVIVRAQNLYAAAIEGNFQLGEMILVSDPVALGATEAYTFKVRMGDFNSDPDFGPNASKDGAEATAAKAHSLPGPKPKSFFQSLMGN